MKFARLWHHSAISPKSQAFQAEYEGSIPFTRSNVFNDLPAIGAPKQSSG
jgi:hypothetical protein